MAERKSRDWGSAIVALLNDLDPSGAGDLAWHLKPRHMAPIKPKAEEPKSPPGRRKRKVTAEVEALVRERRDLHPNQICQLVFETTGVRISIGTVYKIWKEVSVMPVVTPEEVAQIREGAQREKLSIDGLASIADLSTATISVMLRGSKTSMAREKIDRLLAATQLLDTEQKQVAAVIAGMAEAKAAVKEDPFCGPFCGTCKSRNAPGIGSICWLCQPPRHGDPHFSQYVESMVAYRANLSASKILLLDPAVRDAIMAAGAEEAKPDYATAQFRDNGTVEVSTGVISQEQWFCTCGGPIECPNAACPACEGGPSPYDASLEKRIAVLENKVQAELVTLFETVQGVERVARSLAGDMDARLNVVEENDKCSASFISAFISSNNRRLDELQACIDATQDAARELEGCFVTAKQNHVWIMGKLEEFQRAFDRTNEQLNSAVLAHAKHNDGLSTFEPCECAEYHYCLACKTGKTFESQQKAKPPDLPPEYLEYRERAWATGAAAISFELWQKKRENPLQTSDEILQRLHDSAKFPPREPSDHYALMRNFEKMARAVYAAEPELAAAVVKKIERGA